MKVLDKLASKVINRMTDLERIGWPPECNGSIYQPERPTQSIYKNDESKKKENFVKE